jgi:Tol biopolymer transport system component
MNATRVLVLAAVVAGCGSTPAAWPAGSDRPLGSSIAAAQASPTAMPIANGTLHPIGGSTWLIYQGNGLTIAQLDGTGVQPLFGAGGPPEPAHPDWSPNGRQITFSAGHDGSWDIWVADADGSDARTLVDCTSPCTILDGPAWSPIGGEIAFSRLEEVGDALPSELDVVDVASGAVRTIASVPSGLAFAEPRWSRDARSIVVTMEDHRHGDGSLAEHPVESAIGIVNLDDAKPSFRPLIDGAMRANYPDWNPVDDQIVFQAGSQIWWDDITTSRSQIWTIQANGTGLKQISAFQPDDAAAYWMPAWGSSGNRILATRTDRSTRDNAIVYIPLDGSTPHGTIVAGGHARQSRAGDG